MVPLARELLRRRRSSAFACAAWDTSNVPCGGSSSLSGAIYGCATDYYQSTRFIQVQKALDEAFINVRCALLSAAFDR